MNKVKKAGKWFGIVLAGIILLALVVRTVLNIVFGIQLRNTVWQLKAQGRHITIDQIRPAPVPESENAAVLLNQAFTLMTIGEGGKLYTPNQGWSRDNKTVSKIESVESFSDISKWTPEERAEIPKLVYSQDMQRIYDLIEEASRKSKCNFDLKYEEGPAMTLPHLAEMRSVSRLFAVKALIEAQSGNLNGALDTLNTGLRVSNLLKDEPILISKLVMVACRSIMIDCLQGVTKSRDIPRDKASLIIGELSKYTYANFLDGAMALMGEWVLRGEHAYGLFSIMDKRFIPHTFIKKVIIRTEAWFWTPLLKKDLVLYFSAVSQLEDDFKKPYYMTQGKKIPFSIPRYCIVSMTLPALERASTAAARNQAWLDVCKTGLALKIYRGKNGRYPDSLDKLKPEILPEIPLDTFTGKSLIYRKTTKSVIIYSVGENRKDDGGQWGKPSKWSDGYDIVWEE